MSHPRAAYRAAVRAAIAADAAFAGWAEFMAWSKAVDADALPGFAIATPNERAALSTATQANRTTAVYVVAKLLGDEGGIEDALDALSADVERVALPALDALCEVAQLVETEIAVDHEGKRRAGTLTMRFECLRYTAKGQPE